MLFVYYLARKRSGKMKKSSKKVDRRIKKSKDALKEALLTIMYEKDFRDISITEIVQTADLNRGTFYKHYQYKEDVLEEIINEVTTDLIASYREPYKNQATFDSRNLTSAAIKIFEHVAKHSKFYTLVVQSNVLYEFQRKICDTLKHLTLNDLLLNRSGMKVDPHQLASYHAYAIFGMIIEWINGGFKYSPDYMAEQLLEIIKMNQQPIHLQLN